MPETRFLKIIIIALLLINGGTLAFLFWQRPGGEGGPHGRGQGRGSTAEYLNRELHLTAEQERQYKGMRDRHHRANDSLRDNMRRQQARLYGLLGTGDAAQQAAPAAIMDSIAGQQREVERVTFEHFREFRAICTPEQQRRFDEVISEALERLR